jgi:hypothetical protein
MVKRERTRVPDVPKGFIPKKKRNQLLATADERCM